MCTSLWPLRTKAFSLSRKKGRDLIFWTCHLYQEMYRLAVACTHEGKYGETPLDMWHLVRTTRQILIIYTYLEFNFENSSRKMFKIFLYTSRLYSCFADFPCLAFCNKYKLQRTFFCCSCSTTNLRWLLTNKVFLMRNWFNTFLHKV